MGGVYMVKNVFNWVEIRVRDLDKSKRFYESLFDWKISGEENKDFAYWLIDTGEKPGGGMWRFPKTKPTGIIVYILVEDIDKALEKVVKAGGKVVMPKAGEGENFMAVFADPDGNTFGLYQKGKNAQP